MTSTRALLPRLAALALPLAACSGTGGANDPPPSDSAVVVEGGGSDDALTPFDAGPDALLDALAADVAIDAKPDVDDGLVPVFFGQGYMGRTLLSCDDGRSWVADRSDDDTLRCFDSPAHDCDHNGGRAMGMAYGNGWLVGTWGWGEPNSVRRSRDGVTWEKVLTGTVFSGLEFGSARFVAIDGVPRVSMDDGATWKSGSDIGFVGHIRRTGFADFDGGVFVAAGAENDATHGEVMTSVDGLTWRRPTALPSVCGLGASGSSITYGNGVIVMGHDTGDVCRSTDGGRTWTTSKGPGTFATSIVWDGAAFVTFGSASGKNAQFRSTDGVTWLAQPTHLRAEGGSLRDGPDVDPIARGPSGTYVATNAGWQVWYEKQVFYRSVDGVTWEALPAAKYHGGHPLRFLGTGRIPRGGACP